MTELTGLAGLVRDAGLVSLLVFALYGGYKRWWVFGWQYEAALRDKDAWKNIAHRWEELALRGTTLSHKLAEKVQ